MTHVDVQRWLDAYTEAWTLNDPGLIGDLFTEDAVYGYRPWDDDEVTSRGREAIVASWMESPDDPSTWDARYQPYAVDGSRAVAIGWTRYNATDSEPEKLYHNVFLLEFGDDGRCSSFREFFVLQD
jgi:ketosteroid isomerase-like protein